ncbi:sugar ABC transporter ATP-binding protein [Nakamurella leprariae]|uniref:Sugar ABC transporter ATP-binding protein n=1 Tax=Nakamurella leprariae TaxID=2803911 RepID=A0A939BXU7_9ACTN|nr:sugar ABC transporter ATP-binding protein [Nakamurella leprariae]MBM9465956.1 sugar ABC transporter ATP-binding protein [Nakamurella leprariae]
MTRSTSRRTAAANARPAAGSVDGAPPPALRLTRITKTFGPITAVKNLSLTVERNQVVGVIGENGAGKSTLLKILSGLHEPTSGVMEVAGRPVQFRRPQDAVAAGFGVVHQEQSLLSNLSVAENLAMNALSSTDNATRFGWYRWRQLNREAAETLARVGAAIDPRAIVGDLSFVDRQMVEIARALRVDEQTHATPLVILDEPTSVLERNETAILEREIANLKSVGSVIFVSHRLDEVRRICDRIVVMRHGEVVADRPTGDVTEDDLFKLMIGHAAKADKRSDAGRTVGAQNLVEVRGLTRRGEYRDVSFAVRPGRCLVIVGALGSGRESLARTVFGAEPFDRGEIRYRGDVVSSWSTVRATRNGMAYVPAERRTEGMVGGFSSTENITLARTGARPRFVLNRAGQKKLAREWFQRLDVRPDDIKLSLQRFSGGNQQKVVMAKWLQSDRLRVLILDHPLRGLDPGAAETVNDQIRIARDAGTAVILLADTLEEALDMGDDILVMRDGDVTARFDLSVDTPTTLDLLERMV